MNLAHRAAPQLQGLACDPRVRDLLVCPLCRSKLAFEASLLQCTSCQARFAQSSTAWINLLPEKQAVDDRDPWQARQDEMERWYRDLLAEPQVAADCLMNDYRPHAAFLGTLSGWVLDLGGGVGITRHFLRPGVSHVVLDPSLSWLTAAWQTLSPTFPCLATLPCFVRGIGERMPFASESFDGVVAFWSLNHASNPQHVVREIARILRPGGRALAVVEDMPPRWHDFVDHTFPAKAVVQDLFNLSSPRYQKYARLYLLGKHLRRTWPLQSDHVRITEADLRAWSANDFQMMSRRWTQHYVTFELRKRGRART